MWDNVQVAPWLLMLISLSCMSALSRITIDSCIASAHVSSHHGMSLPCVRGDRDRSSRKSTPRERNAPSNIQRSHFAVNDEMNMKYTLHAFKFEFLDGFVLIGCGVARRAGRMRMCQESRSPVKYPVGIEEGVSYVSSFDDVYFVIFLIMYSFLCFMDLMNARASKVPQREFISYYFSVLARVCLSVKSFAAYVPVVVVAHARETRLFACIWLVVISSHSQKKKKKKHKLIRSTNDVANASKHPFSLFL